LSLKAKAKDLSLNVKTNDLSLKAKAKDLSLNAKTKDLSLKATVKAKAKAKNMPYCPQGTSRPRTWP